MRACLWPPLAGRLTCEAPKRSSRASHKPKGGSDEGQNRRILITEGRTKKSSLSSLLVIAIVFAVMSSSTRQAKAFLHLQSAASSNSTASDMRHSQHGNMSSSMIVVHSTPMTNGSLVGSSGGGSQQTISSTTSVAVGEKQRQSNSSSTSAQNNHSGATKQAPQTSKQSSATSNTSPARLKQQQQQQSSQGKQAASRTGNDNQMAADDAQVAFMTINSAPTSIESGSGSAIATAGSAQAPSPRPSQVSVKVSPPSSEEHSTMMMRPPPPGGASQSSNGKTSSRANGWPSQQWRPKQTPWQPYPQQHERLYMNQQQQVDSSEGLDASLTGQLERPSGYSYGESGGASVNAGALGQSSGSYTYVSQIKPARQELMQATEQQQRNRARQQQFHSTTTSRAFEQHQQQARPATAHADSASHHHHQQQQQQHSLSQNHIEQLGISSTGNSAASQLPHFNSGQRPLLDDPIEQLRGVSNPCRPPPVAFHSGTHQDSSLFPTSATTTLANNEIASGQPAKYVRAGAGTRLRSQFIFKVIRADSLTDCEAACSSSLLDACRSFNYRAYFAAENCELSRLELRALRLEDGAQFEQHTQFDFYALDSPAPLSAPLMMQASASSIQQQQLAGYSAASPFSASALDDCLDVSQSCSQDGMEFSLRTVEPFNGRIYTYGFYDSCFVDGQGSTSSQLKISRSGGFPRCGTQQFGDLMTNIVVVQFNDYVQTTRDKKYNLTCYFSGPGEAVVTSNYLDTKIDERSHPIQIEHLPPQNVITSNVHLRILYRGQPTNTIAVGDLLTFRLETRPNGSPSSSGQSGGGQLAHMRGELSSALPHNEIFATNVIAKDPYSGRQVQLIDARGCPLDPINVFPELQRTPDGALESEFYAFKIPDSNFLIFQATVRTCKAPCEPVICPSSAQSGGATANPIRAGGHQTSGIKGQYLMAAAHQQHQLQVPSWGKRRRRFTEELDEQPDELLSSGESIEHVIPVRMAPHDTRQIQTIRRPELSEAEQEVKEMFRVFMSRAEISKRQQQLARQQQQRQQMDDNQATLIKLGQTNNAHSGNGTAVLEKAFSEALAISAGAPAIAAEQLINVCMTQSSYYVMLFTVISLSLILLSIASVAMYVTRKTSKLHISQSIAESMY